MDNQRTAVGRHPLSAGRLLVAVLGVAAVQLLSTATVLAKFTDPTSAGGETLSSATLPTPTGLAVTNGGCSGGATKTNVSASWTGSATLDANAGYVTDNYTLLRATSLGGTYALAGTTTGSPPATTYTDVNPTGSAPQFFVANDNGSNTVHAVNISTNAGTSIATGTVGIEPNNLAVTPDGATVVVAEGASHQVQVITVSSDTIARSVTIPIVAGTASRPDAVAVTPDGLTAFVVDGANGRVYPLTIASGALGAAIVVGAQGDPGAMLVTPDGKKVYVANYGGHTVSAITTSSNTVTATVTIGTGTTGVPIAVAVLPNSTHVYVADQGNAQIDDIATLTDTVAAKIAVGSLVNANFAGGGDPNTLAVTADGATVYESSYTGGGIGVITTSTDAVATIILPPGGYLGPPAPNAIALAPNGCQLYVDDYNNNKTDIIWTATNTVVASPPVGGAGGTGDPIGMTVSPDSAFCYVTNFYDNSVSVINASTNTTAATLGSAVVGNNPYAVLATPSTYYYKVQGGHGGWRGAQSSAVSLTLDWDQGGWQ